MRNLMFPLLALVLCSSQLSFGAEQQPKYLLKAKVETGNATIVDVDLEVGGELISLDDKAKQQKLSLSVSGKLSYYEQFIATSDEVMRSLRKYNTAQATIQTGDRKVEKDLPASQRLVAADLRDGQCVLNGCNSPLSREELDLISVVGNSVVVNQLLPDREMPEGENWDHDNETIRALLDMDHVAVCDVSSVIVGESHGQVQIRVGGTVHGAIDGTTTELDLRGAYLFHQKLGRITKFNLAIKEKRAAGEVTPGLDVIAKATILLKPVPANSTFSKELVQQTSDIAQPLRTVLLYDASDRGFRLQHDTGWFITAEQRDLISLRYLKDNTLTSHCNITTLPARSAGRGTSLEQFEQDVRNSLGDNVKEVVNAKEWTTSSGHNCLGVIANGTVKGVEVQWRYYMISNDNLPRVTLAVTVEQEQLKLFDDADRELVSSLQLVPIATTKTAKKKAGKTAK